MSAQNREKLTPFPLSAKCMNWLNTLPLCPWGHTIKFEKFRSFLHQKVRMSASEQTPLVRSGQTEWGRFYGRPLITLGTTGICISEPKIASCLKLRMIVIISKLRILGSNSLQNFSQIRPDLQLWNNYKRYTVKEYR